MSPEVVNKENHDEYVDYWALGVLLYELTYGRSPFYADDNYTIYKNIKVNEPSLFFIISFLGKNR